VTAIAGLLRPADRERLLERVREPYELNDLMRRPGLLSSPAEPVPLHRAGRGSVTSRTTMNLSATSTTNLSTTTEGTTP
jgi:hypothetical protein